MYVANIFLLTDQGQIISRAALPDQTFMYRSEVKGSIVYIQIDGERHTGAAELRQVNQWMRKECALDKNYIPCSKMGFYGVKTI